MTTWKSSTKRKRDDHRPNADGLREKIEAMRERRARLREIQDPMNDSGQSQISLTDPDSRAMPVGGSEATVVGYTILAQGNVQVSVDAKYKLIVDHDVTNEVIDFGLLSQMAQGAKEALAIEEIDLVADMGYREACCALRRPTGERMPGRRHPTSHPKGQHLCQPPAGACSPNRTSPATPSTTVTCALPAKP